MNKRERKKERCSCSRDTNCNCHVTERLRGVQFIIDFLLVNSELELKN